MWKRKRYLRHWDDDKLIVRLLDIVYFTVKNRQWTHSEATYFREMAVELHARYSPDGGRKKCVCEECFRRGHFAE